MSLCPFYCDCDPCKHGVNTCSTDCGECETEFQLKERQKKHKESVRKQKMKLKPLAERGDK